MLPNTEYLEYDEELEEILSQDMEEEEIAPGLTWKLDETTHTITGEIDGEDALAQACYMALRTEFGEYVIFDEYGLDLSDCYGMDMEYAQVEAEAQIKDTLMRDDRIDDVSDFEWEVVGLGVLKMSCTVYSKMGTQYQLSEVEINV